MYSWWTEVTDEILDVLDEGARTKGYIVEETGRHRNTVKNHLNLLAVAGEVEIVHEETALYERPKETDE